MQAMAQNGLGEAMLRSPLSRGAWAERAVLRFFGNEGAKRNTPIWAAEAAPHTPSGSCLGGHTHC